MWFADKTAKLWGQAASKTAFAHFWNVPAAQVTGPYLTEASAKKAAGVSGSTPPAGNNPPPPPSGSDIGSWWVVYTASQPNSSQSGAQVLQANTQQELDNFRALKSFSPPESYGPYSSEGQAQAKLDSLKQNPPKGLITNPPKQNPIQAFLSNITSRDFIVRAVEVILGAGLVLVGSLALMRDPANNAVARALQVTPVGKGITSAAKAVKR